MKFTLEQLVELNRIVKENKEESDRKFDEIFRILGEIKAEIEEIDNKEIEAPVVSVDLSETNSLLQQILDKPHHEEKVEVELKIV